jgi:hypothetical protein
MALPGAIGPETATRTLAAFIVLGSNPNFTKFTYLLRNKIDVG